MTAIADIAAERRRQIEAEGWTPEHDDSHTSGEMADAAACYAASARWHGIKPLDVCPSRWPWSRDWWKPKDRRRDLIRAAALIVAEIERLDRASGTIYEAATLNFPMDIRIKPLEWHGPDYEDEYWAYSLERKYTIGARGEQGRWMGSVGGYFASVDEAKAAAQADHEKRIRSALIAPPAGDER